MGPHTLNLAVFVAAGYINLMSAYSSVARALEKLNVEKVIIVHTDTSDSNAQKLKEKLDEIRVPTELTAIPSDKELFKNRIEAIKRIKESSGAEVAVVSPA